jgi:TRAP-type C4-dicarboxylate transport system substrate-binding protein
MRISGHPGTMKRLLATLILAAAQAAPAGAAMAETIKLGTLAPAGSPWYEVLVDMGEAWKESSGGRINLRIYAGGVAGDESDMVRKMRIGQLHAATLSAGGLPDVAPEFRALQLPMLFASYEELDYVRDRIAPMLEEIIEDRGFKVLAWGDAGWLRFFTSKPVVGPDDLQSLPLFVWVGNTAFVEAWKSAGFNPVSLPATEIHTALQSGLIEAVAVPPIIALSYQWFGQVKHMTDLGWVPMVGAIVVRTKTWSRIPEGLRPDLLAAAEDAGRRMRGEIRSFSEEAVAVMQRHGLQVHAVPPVTVAEWESRARASYPRLLGTVVPEDMAAAVERLRDEYRNSD